MGRMTEESRRTVLTTERGRVANKLWAFCAADLAVLGGCSESSVYKAVSIGQLDPASLVSICQWWYRRATSDDFVQKEDPALSAEALIEKRFKLVKWTTLDGTKKTTAQIEKDFQKLQEGRKRRKRRKKRTSSK